jgi:hypothetical protein
MSMFDYDARPVTPLLVLVGTTASRGAYAIRDFLSRNGYPFEWVDVGLGVILAIVLLPSRRRLGELRTGAAEPTPAPEPQPAPQAIPVALTGCSPVIHPVSGAAVAAGRGSHLVRA